MSEGQREARRRRQARREARRAQLAAEREARQRAREQAWQRRMGQEVWTWRMRGGQTLTLDLTEALALDFDPDAVDPVAGLRERLEWLRALRAAAEAGPES